MNNISFLVLLALLAQSPTATAQQDGSLQAAFHAKSDFNKRLASEPGDWEYGNYVSNIDNYSVGISSSPCCYHVVFLLKKTDALIRGGGGKYTINKKSLKIISFEGYD